MLCLCGHPAAAHTVECDEPGCPCLGFAPVAEGPYVAMESMDVSLGAAVFNPTTGQFMSSDPTWLDEMWRRPPVSLTRPTNTVADLSKKEWKP